MLIYKKSVEGFQLSSDAGKVLQLKNVIWVVKILQEVFLFCSKAMFRLVGPEISEVSTSIF